MDNITFLNNPQKNRREDINTTGTNTAAKAAKLDNKNKRPVLVEHYNDELAKMAKIVNEVASPEHGYDAALGRLNINATYYDAKTQIVSARKLKVKSGVVDKNVLAHYNKSIDGMKPTIVFSREELDQYGYSSPEPKEEFKLPPIVEEAKQPITPIAETRVGRLERTGEIPVVNKDSGVINAPDRFATKPVDNSNVIPFPSRADRMQEPIVNPDVKQLEVGQEARRLDRINALSQTNEGDLSLEIQDAQKRLEKAVDENRRVVSQSANLEEQIRNIKASVEALRRQKLIAQKEELAKTREMLAATEEETLGATRRMANLQQELAKLMQERDAMLENQSYSRGRAA